LKLIPFINLDKLNLYIPAKNELLSLRDNIELLNASLSAISGGITIKSDSTYWSSTQGTNLQNAYTVDVTNGTVNEVGKTNSNPVRPFAIINQ
ncbi:MAG: hypothetical protein II707_05170, partial [Spirochaetales bacterium]|nr:hypothetical protein [Spirochaetales bacterium]